MLLVWRAQAQESAATPTVYLPLVVRATETTISNPTNTPVPGSTVISFGAAPTPTFLGGDFTVTTTTNSNGVLTYSVVSGPCSVVNASAGTFASTAGGTCIVQASVAATANFRAASSTQSITIAPATTVIAWANPAAIAFGTALDATQLNASAVAGGSAVDGTFSYNPAAGTQLNIGTGQILSVSFTPSNTANFTTPAAKTVTINVSKANQAITFAALPPKVVGDPNFTVSATASSGLVVTFSAPSGACQHLAPTTIRINAFGSCTVTASQAGNANFNAAPSVAHTFAILNAPNQTITFASLSNKTVGDPPFTVSATASSGLLVTFTVGVNDDCTIAGTTVTITSVSFFGGSCTVTAHQEGNLTFTTARSVARTFSISP